MQDALVLAQWLMVLHFEQGLHMHNNAWLWSVCTCTTMHGFGVCHQSHRVRFTASQTRVHSQLHLRGSLKGSFSSWSKQAAQDIMHLHADACMSCYHTLEWSMGDLRFECKACWHTSLCRLTCRRAWRCQRSTPAAMIKGKSWNFEWLADLHRITAQGNLILHDERERRSSWHTHS